MTNGNGGPPTSASGLPVNGSEGSPQGGSLAVGQGPVTPAAGTFGPSSGGPSSGQASPPAAGSRIRRRGAQAPVPASASAPAGGEIAHKRSPFSISNWRVRWRLVAIITVPTVTALVLGAIQIGSSVNNYTSFKRVQELAALNSLVVQAVGDLANERDAAAGFVAAGGQSNTAASAPLKRTLEADIAKTSGVTSQITTLANRDANAGFSQQTADDLSNNVVGRIQDLPLVRQAVLQTKTPALSVIGNYEGVVQPFVAFANDVAAGTGNETLQSDVSVLNALLRMEDDASLQRAYLYQALETTPAALTPTALADLNQAAEQQQADTNAFDQEASVAEQQTEANTVAGPQVDEAESAEKLAIATTDANENLTIGQQQSCAGLSQAQCWMSTQSTQINDMRQVSNGLVSDITAQANSLASNSLRTAVEISAATLLLLLIVLLITIFVARSMIRPLRKLRADALEVAGSKLPEMVRRLSETEGGDASAEIEPIGVSSTDEIGEVARAFDQVHREAVRLAADEAMLRGNLNAMFVNLSRRSQSLIERQLSLIDNLEQSEQDADRLSSLFRLDHLATRMRRNSENLLVLAGHEAVNRRWSQPVPLVDVLRAAISEIEQYERVVLNVQPGIQVVGQAVNDIVHLVAEIVENATTFSPEDTQVYVTGQPLSSGGVLLEVTDNGVGISEQEMSHANWRLDNPPVVDVAVSRRMGLFVVGRLAARHGVRVRLRHAQSGGLTALIWLPESLAAPDGGQPLGRLRNFESDDYGPAPSLSAPAAIGGSASGGTGHQPAPNLPSAPARPTGGNGSGLTGAAATASRIPRLGGGGQASTPNGGFGAVGPSGGNARPAPAGPNGSDGSGADTIDAPGGPLPVRTPGNRPLGSATSAGSTPEASGDNPSRDFASTRMPALGGDGGSVGTGSLSPTRPMGPGQPMGPGHRFGGSDGGQVTVPPTISASAEQRLPIFDSLESDWFRRSGKPLSSAAAPVTGQSWKSPADEGWRAAQLLASPEAGETTTAGLPKRVPRANLVPGSVGAGDDDGPTEDTPPTRSADTIRDRMSSFQRGLREARAAGSSNEEP